MDLGWEAFGALVMVWGTWLLARSPLVSGRPHHRLRDRVLHPHGHQHTAQPVAASARSGSDSP
jgi:hypothetical protein